MSQPAILLLIIAVSALLMSALGLFNLPDPLSHEQIAAAQRYLDGVCVSCPMYEKLPQQKLGPDSAVWVSRTIP